jgi:uncharacterized membrane protein YedE/YeeE
MIEFISQPWPWYVSGPSIAIIMFLLLWVGGTFGVSSTLRTACAIGGAGKHSSYFNFNWKTQIWNLVFVGGAILGGWIAANFLPSNEALTISEATIADLAELNISFDGGLAPEQIFNWSSLLTLKGFLVLVVGGFLVGFGTRWAGGCTSGHAITGLSNLQIPSLIAVVGFFIGGLIMTFLIYPFIF